MVSIEVEVLGFPTSLQAVVDEFLQCIFNKLVPLIHGIGEFAYRIVICAHRIRKFSVNIEDGRLLGNNLHDRYVNMSVPPRYIQ